MRYARTMDDINPNALSVSDVVEELQSLTEFQDTIRDFDYEDYEAIVKRAIRRLYVDTGRAADYSESLFVVVKGSLYFNKEVPADEYEYILVCAKLEFYKIVSDYYSDMTSYTTDALTVANGDKPYQNMKGKTDSLEEDRRKIYYAMARFLFGEF